MLIIQIISETIFLGCIYTLVGLAFSYRYANVKYLDLGAVVYVVLGAYLYLLFENILLAGLGVLVVAYLAERCYFQKLQNKKVSNLVLMVASLGFMTVVQALIAMYFTSSTQVLSTDILTYNFFGVSVTITKIVTVALTTFICIVLYLFLYFTKTGMYLRAMNDSKELAEINNLPVERISILVAMFTAMLLGLAGGLYALENYLDPFMGMNLLLAGATAAIVSGLSNLNKMYVGGFVLATLQGLVIWFVGGEWKDAATFALLITLLLYKK